MRAHVRGDAARLREPAAAHRAAEGLLPGVRPAVGRQVGGLHTGTDFKWTWSVQGGPSGCTLPFVGFKTKVPSQYSLLILKPNSQFDVNKT